MAVTPKHGGLYKLDPTAVGKTKGKTLLQLNSTPIVVYNNTFFFHSSLNVSPTNKIACSSSMSDVLHARLGHTSLSKMKHITDCKPYISESFFRTYVYLPNLIDCHLIKLNYYPFTFRTCSHGPLGSLHNS